MSNPTFFYAIAGISMSFAGFASLFLALRQRDTTWEPYEVGQVNSIVLFALTALFSALVVVPLASSIGEPSALRGVSAILFGLGFYIHQVRVGTSWLRWSEIRSENQSKMARRDYLLLVAPFACVAIAEQVLFLVNVVMPTQELYELALIAMLGTPALVFVLVITQLGSHTRL
jgi:hypothetical protein